MHQKIKIVSALVPALALVVCGLLPPVALAGGPLLSGYGGPGAGEQSILGSTLVGGSGGGSGSGGASGSGGGSGSGGSSGGSTGGSQGGGGAASSTGATGGSSAVDAGPGQAGTAKSRTGEALTRRGRRRLGGSAAVRPGTASVGRAGVNAYVYPTTLHAASYSSPVLGISGGDLLALVVTIATLALLGVLTIRMGRLQA